MTGNAPCSKGRPASVCCVGTPWDSPNIAEQILYWGEPLYPSVIEVAAREDFLAVAEQVDSMVVDEGLCCPVCEEVDCDEGCPLTTVRGGSGR